MKKQKITAKDFERVWKTKLSPFMKNKIKAANLEYRDLTEKERDEAIKQNVRFLLADQVTFSGEHRHDQWESGWAENLEAFNKKLPNALVPRYFGKHKVNRFNQKFIMPFDKNFELKMTSTLEAWLFDKYLRNVPVVYEFGAGTGHNLLRLREVNPTAELWGLDWATSSQRLIQEIAKKLGDDKLKAHNFNYFKPDHDFKLDPRGAVFTALSLEQTGDRFKDFVDYILKQKPAICVHVEPLNEVLDEKHLLDYLSIEYAKKRKYLNNFVSYLKDLEKKGKVKILKVQRSHVASLFIDGDNIVVWKPL